MKKLLLITSVSFFAATTIAQSVDDAKKAIYYERWQTAKNILQPMLTGDNAPEAAYWLSEVYLYENKMDSATAVYTKLPADFLTQTGEYKKHPLPFIGQAHLQLNNGKTTEARTQMDEVLKANKYKDAEALLAAAKANIESKNGDANWALELLDKAIKKDKKNPAIYVAMGDAQLKLQNGGGAVSNYMMALQLDQHYAAAPYKEGLVYKTQKNEEIFLQKFNQSYQADSTYTPVIYELYTYYFFKDVKQANQYLTAYIRNSEPDPKHAYMLADLDYVSKKYQEAINSAQNILTRDGENVQPRIYKLMAYSHAALGDSATALKDIDTYFNKQADSNVVPKDYALKASLLQKAGTDTAAAIEWYEKALAADTVKEQQLEYVTALADLNQQLGNKEKEAYYRGRIYEEKANPTNLDIYKWGMALYNADEYEKADSVFAIYEHKYPDQIYGPLMRARANALIDSTMELGLAVPHYQKLTEVAAKDSLKNKQVLLTAYQYLGAYEATVTKNYEASLEYYDKVLAINPNDAEAEKNARILSKWIEQGKGTKSN